jgi:diaminohydroxyphosphoribosylaminopyrimidine deaminase/5-amino-6-(5-phosphoribosylamino)uracil reductase
VVLDTRGRLPPTAQLVQTARQVPTLLVTSAEEPRLAPLRSAGCEILTWRQDAAGRPDLVALLRELGRRRWTNLLVEGGASVLGSFLDAALIDEVHVFIAPRLAGGSEAKGPIGGHGCERIAETLALHDCKIETLDGDLYVRGTRHATA